MAISRRTLLNTAGATALTAGFPLLHAQAADGPIKVGCIEDNSGVLDIYGKPIVMANALAIAATVGPCDASPAPSGRSCGRRMSTLDTTLGASRIARTG